MKTIAEMRASGASRHEIDRLKASLQRVRRGVYAPETGDAWETYRQKCLAVSRSISGAVLAGPSAAVLHGFSLVDDPPEVVYVRGVTRGSYGSDVRVVVGGEHATEVLDGVLVTAAAWTVVDCARVMTRREALIIADNALHLGACTIAQLWAVAETLGKVKCISRVRWAIRCADGRSESPGETWLRLILMDAGVLVTPQHWIRDGEFSARVDLLVDGTWVVLEFDGLEKYKKHNRRHVEAVIRAERARQAQLERLGYVVIRFMWEQLSDPAAVIQRVRKTLQRVGSAA